MSAKAKSFLNFENEDELIKWLRENIKLELATTPNGDYYSTWETTEVSVSYKGNVLATDEITSYTN